jgi:hypothetical protein
MMIVLYVGPFSGLFATQEGFISMSRGSETKRSVDQHGLCRLLRMDISTQKLLMGITIECPNDWSGWR